MLGRSAAESRKTALDALDSVGLAERSEHRPLVSYQVVNNKG